MRSLESLARKIGHQFSDLTMLQTACTHRSAGREHNERLEFLGDAILGFFVADVLYQQHPDAREGLLTRARAALVRKESLSEVARDLGLGDYLILGSGELKSGGRQRDSILADALEALIGAVYLDGGLEAARRFVVSVLSERLSELSPLELSKDPKTALQEFCQSRRVSRPVYSVVDVAGEPHESLFTVSCLVEAFDIVTSAQSSNRRLAEQRAAAQALEQIPND